MRDQDVITRLVELHDHIQAPATSAGEDALRGERLVRRRRAVVAVVAVAAAAVSTVGLVQASLVGDSSELKPAPAPSSVVPSDPVEPSRIDGDRFASEFNEIVAEVPEWSIADIQTLFTVEPCAGSWSWATQGFSGGNFNVRVNGEPGQVWHDVMRFPTTAQASAAVDRLVTNLASCDEAAWQVRAIARTGAMLAASSQGLMWIQQSGEDVSTLHAVTDDGPPPLAVQVEVAELMAAHLR